ncbi:MULTISPECIES: transporter [Actinosynnema]|uniref:transporter n=1 Tax=Actinosynnema TaxID=40566 RepID=UPI0020A4FAD5|nr:transporter [Actinosynnema pretiosum]MCP2098906.1 Tripartite ATP-independent transporter, DctM component [Actinosynnema pretiosum]
MGIAVLAVMAIGVALMLTRVLPTAFALGLLAVVIALLSGASLVGKENSVTAVLQNGSALLASTMIAVLLGSWLGTLMSETGIAATLVRKIVEFGGERPAVVALGVYAVAVLCGSITGSAPAAMLAGVVGIPAMIAVGVPPVVAGGTVLMGLATGLPVELIGWQFLSDAVDLPLEQVRAFQLKVFPIALVVGVAYVLVEVRRRGARHAWAVRAAKAPDKRARRGDAPWYALVAPLLPIVLALGFELPIVPSLLAGVVFALLTTTRPGRLGETAMRSLYRAFDVAAPPLVLFVAIGMLLSAVRLPGAVAALDPVVSAVSPSGPVLFVVVFALLVPLCLYRGPLNVYGLGAGIAGVLAGGGVYPVPAVLGLMSSYGQVLCVSDPTSTQTVWSAQYAGVRPEKVMASTLPYTWVMAVGVLTLTSVLFLA